MTKKLTMEECQDAMKNYDSSVNYTMVMISLLELKQYGN